jgi:type IV pilus assembly protein PilA
MRSRGARKGKQAFTLIELMIVVAIVGILAVLAIYGVRRYLQSAKSTEAHNSLGQMAKDAYAHYQNEGMPGAVLAPGGTAGQSNVLCLSASAAVPSSKTSIAGEKYQSTPSDWNKDQSTNSGFACLKFTMDQPQYYMYSYSADTSGTSWFTGIANGDLNGDTTLSTYSIAGSVQGGVLTVAPNIVDINAE